MSDQKEASPAADDPSGVATIDPASDAAAPQTARPAAERVVVLTGATSGIGRAAAEGIARRESTLILVARDSARGSAAVDEIKAATGNDRVELMVADLSLLSEVRRLAATLVASDRKIDGLVNNAGVKLSHRTVTAEGIETTLAVNHLAPYLLSALLKDKLQLDGGGRIVNVNSFMHARASGVLDDLQCEQSYSENAVYSRSKLLNLLTTYHQARLWEPDAVTVNAYNPGFVRTNMTRGGWVGVVAPLFAKSPKLAADGIVFLAVSPRVESVTGVYYLASARLKNSSADSYDEALQARAVELTDALLAAH